MIKFTLPYPESKKQKARFCREYGLNAYYAGKHWSKRKGDADYWRVFVHTEMRRQHVPEAVAENPVSVRFLWDDGLDCDNHGVMGKYILDALKGYLIHDDDRRYVHRVAHEMWRGGCIEVQIVDESKTRGQEACEEVQRCEGQKGRP